MSNSDIVDVHLVAIGIIALIAGVLAFLHDTFTPAYVIAGCVIAGCAAFLALLLKEHHGLIKTALIRKK